jgi:hypothetical protein
MSQLFRNTTVPPRPGRVMGPARAGLKAAPFSAPHEGAEDQGQADRDRREVGGGRPRCSPTTGPARAYRRHVCAEPLDARGGGGSLHHMPSRKADGYRYYVSAALITEAGTDRAQGGRIVARVLGPRPERLSIGGVGLCPPDPLIRLRIAASSNADVLESDGDRLAVRNYLYPYARVIARALAARVAEGFWVRFAPDSPPQRASIPVLALEAQPPTGLPSRSTCRGAGPLQVLKTRGFEGDSRQAGPVRPVYNADQPVTALKGTGIRTLGPPR